LTDFLQKSIKPRVLQKAGTVLPLLLEAGVELRVGEVGWERVGTAKIILTGERGNSKSFAPQVRFSLCFPHPSCEQ